MELVGDLVVLLELLVLLFAGIGLVFPLFLVLLELVWFGCPTFLQSAGSRSRLSGRESADSGET